MIDQISEFTKKEMVEIVARVIKNKMEEENIEPMPSESSIGRILSRHGLTYGRIGFCD